jgi:hypothetical protein
MANFPRPTLNEVKQDDSIMHYVREGDFATSDIGATAQGKVGTIKSERLDIKHVDQGR